MSISSGAWRFLGKGTEACFENVSSNVIADGWIARYEAGFDTDIGA